MSTDDLLDKIEELEDSITILQLKIKELDLDVERLFNVLNLIK
jgi:hypothetical protein